MLSLFILVSTAVAYLALLGVCLPVVIGTGIVLYCYRKKRKTIQIVTNILLHWFCHAVLIVDHLLLNRQTPAYTTRWGTQVSGYMHGLDCVIIDAYKSIA